MTITEEAAEKLKGKGVKVVKVDCPSSESVCSKYGVDGYPTIRLFKDGELSGDEYAGPRTAEAFVDYASGAAKHDEL